MNMTVITGTLVRPPELRDGSYGAFCNSSLMCLNGQKRVYIPFVAYGELAEKMSRISAESKIAITGILDNFKDKEDNYRLSITVKDFELLSGNMKSILDKREFW